MLRPIRESGHTPPPEHVNISLWRVQGVRETARSILAQDGIRGLYRGFGTVMLGAVPARVVRCLPCASSWGGQGGPLLTLLASKHASLPSHNARTP